MTTRTTKRTKRPEPEPTAERLELDAEARALMANPAFRAALDQAKDSFTAGSLSLEDLDRELGLTDATHDNAFLDALDRLEAEQAAEVTDVQGRMLRLVLAAADCVRGRGGPAQLAEETGVPEEEIRAAAAALRVADLDHSVARSVRRPAPASPPGPA